MIIRTVAAFIATAIIGASAGSSFAGEAAPFTRVAGDKINRTFYTEGEKLRGSRQDIPDMENDPAAAGKFMVGHCRDVYKVAGYDYDATIRAVADHIKANMKSDNNVETVLRDPALARTPFSQVMESLILGTVGGPAQYSGSFDGSTLESVNFLYDAFLKKVNSRMIKR